MANQEKNQLATITPNSIVMPAVNGEQALEAWKQYQDLKNKIVDPTTDVQHIQGKDFLKKSYWRKVCTFFNLTVEVVKEERESVGKTFVWHFTCKAIAPNGRSAIGTGSCDAFEKAVLRGGIYVAKGRVTKWGKTNEGKSFPEEWEWTDAVPNSIHNIRSTAETRAFNRAVSNLVGGGEVSAEEISTVEQPIDITSTAQTSKAINPNTKKDEDEIVVTCEVCSKTAYERKGTTKGGKQYHGIFCSTEDRTHTRWLWD